MFRGNWKALIGPRHFRGIGQWYASQPGSKAWKFDPEQERDDRGRWTAGGGGGIDTSRLTGKPGKEGPIPAALAQERMQSIVDRAKADGNFEKDAAWYSDCHDIIGEHAAAMGVDPQTFAGMVAATSPQCAWETSTGRLMNVELAEKAVDAARANPELTGKELASQAESPGMLRNSLGNAVDIYNGKPVDEVLQGPKVSSFYNNMVYPNGTRDVTIDTHMARAMADDHALDAAGIRSFATTNYGWAADQVRAVADANNISPAQAQAVVWSQWRREG